MLCSFEKSIGQLIFAAAYLVVTYIAVRSPHSWYGLASVSFGELQVSNDSCFAMLAFLGESWYRFCMF